jgi:dTDP-L-rhamnose 4-epimerase
MRKILITGGAGFIGSNLALALTGKGYEVTVLDSLSEQIHGSDPLKTSPLYRSVLEKVRFVHGNVTNYSDWKNALDGQDAVIHLAAETGTGQSMYEIQRYTEVNIGGTAMMLDILTNTKHGIRKIVVASSRAIYGEGKYLCDDHGIVFPEARASEDMAKGDFECKCPVCLGKLTLMPTSEDSMIHPTSVYGITKQNQEQMVMMIGKSLNIPAVGFRYQNVYGPGQSLSNPYTGILSIFSTQIKNGNPLNIFEDGKESRDFVYIDDVVHATILGLENHEADYEVFNVGSDQPIDVLEVASALKTSYKSDVDIRVTGNYRIGDIRHNYADLTKISEKLGFKPAFYFRKGIGNFCEWVNKQEVQKDEYSNSVEEMKLKGLFK